MNLNEMVFNDIVPIEVPVTINRERFILREATEEAAIKFRNACMAGARMEDGKVVGVSNMAETQALLVSLCLFADDKPVPPSVIKRWPSRVVKSLFEKAKEISQLDEKETRATLEDKMAKLRAQLESMKGVDGEEQEKNALINSPQSTTDNSPSPRNLAFR